MHRSKALPGILAGLGLSLIGCFSDRSAVGIAGPSEADGTPAARTASTNFVRLPFLAHDVSVGSDGTLLRLDVPSMSDGNHAIQQWLGDTRFQTLPGSADQLSVPVANQFMAIKADNTLWQVINNNWTAMGSAIDVTSKLQTYRINLSDPTAPGFTISKREGNSWYLVNGVLAHRIAVAPNGDLWALNSEIDRGAIWRRPAGSTSWTRIPGMAGEITISYDGTVYVTGPDFIHGTGGFQIYKFLPGTGTWQRIKGNGTKIAGGRGRSLYVVCWDNTVWYSPDPPNG